MARIKPMLQELVDKYMADVNKDEEEGFGPRRGPDMEGSGISDRK